jgi:hypothetical protein
MRSALAMPIPPISPILALPLTGLGFASLVIFRILASGEAIDDHTAIPLFTAISVVVTVSGFCIWGATKWALCQQRIARAHEKIRVQNKLIKYLCRQLPQIDEKHSPVAEMLAELDESNESLDRRNPDVDEQ